MGSCCGLNNNEQKYLAKESDLTVLIKTDPTVMEYLPNQIDPITLEEGVYVMPCRHKIGSACMRGQITNLLSLKQNLIRCPDVSDSGVKCNTDWDYKICVKVAKFNETQANALNISLCENFFKKYAKKCPNPNGCGHQVLKERGQRGDRVVCSSCNFNFCFYCCCAWTSTNQFCNSEQCILLDKILSNSPWNRVFSLNLRGQENFQDYHIPKERSCTSCKAIIENVANCKHTKCPFCPNWSFCWVCLQSPGTNGWPCGLSSQYCGLIAPIQILASRR